MDKDNNNSSNLQDAFNNVPTENANELPALNKDAQANPVDVNNVKSVFEDMNVSTQAAGGATKPENMENAPVQQNAQQGQSSLHH